MLKFFRKIRQQLLRENQTSKYLLYAAGEILLVMIGILLALQVNNWNERQKARFAEQQLLQDLLQEFQSNQQLLEKKRQNLVIAIQNNEGYIKKLAKGKQTYKDMTSFEGKVMMGAGTSDPTLGVIKSLIASGDIKLIRNSKLKYLLTSWQDNVGDLKENEKIHLNDFFNYANYVRALVPQQFQTDGGVDFYDIPPHKLERKYLELAKDTQYRNYISLNKAHMATQVLPEVKYVLNACNQIIQLIESELAK